jgi:RNA polymerase sigma factor (sigma-70 family)
MTLEELYHQSLEVLPPILRGLGREKRLSPEDVEDLRSEIQVKLLKDDYRVLRRWDSRSSLKVYLETLVYNIWHDWLRDEKGKVRVSAAARRLGPPAPLLEKLLGLERLTLEEAYQLIKPKFPGLSRGEVDEIAAQINPWRGRRFENEDVVRWLPDLKPTGAKRLEQREKLDQKRKALALMHRLLSELPEQDRNLLVRAHAEGVKFSCIARSLGIDQQPLYRRNERLITKLRTALEEAGIRWEDLSEALGIDEVEGAWRRMAETVTPTDLAAFLEGSLTGEERDWIVRHLNHCPNCFERYIGAARLLDAIEEGEASAG